MGPAGRRPALNRREALSALAGLAALSAGALTACGSGSGSAAAKDADGATAVKVGVMPIAALAPLYLGVEKGFFKQRGLKLEPQVTQSGAAIVPAVLSGQQQFGFGNPVTLMTAREKGLPVKIVALGSQAGPGDSKEFEGVIAAKDGPIREPKDLAGKTVAVNALNNIGGLLISGALRERGVDPSSIEFMEIGFPDVNAAIESGRVDAAYQTEPFLYQAKQAGHRVVLYQYPVLGERITIANYFTSEQIAERDPKTVEGFQAAINESLEFAAANPDEVRRVVTTFTKIPPAVAKEMTLPGWSPDLDPASSGLDLVGRLAVEDGLLKKRPDFGALIAS